MKCLSQGIFFFFIKRPEITDLYCVHEANVPLIQIKYENIPIDISMAILSQMDL